MILGTSTISILILALVLDRLAGEPDWLWRRVPHPVVWFGQIIALCEKRFNRQQAHEVQREKWGFGVIAMLMIVSIVIGWVISVVFLQMGAIGMLLEVCIVAVFLAQKSLADHVRNVASALRQRGLEGGRSAVAMIVGRNTETLDESGVCRAAIESLAENASDGVMAPAFWYLFFGLPGLFAYKMLNTADSMIGHKSPRYRAFGRASAQLDDLANWLPARLTACLILLTGGISDIEENAISLPRNARLHRSPNAGWPESAMALVLGVALGGPRVYDDDKADEPFLNPSGRQMLSAFDIESALKVFARAMLLGTVLVAVLAVLTLIF